MLRPTVVTLDPGAATLRARWRDEVRAVPAAVVWEVRRAGRRVLAVGADAWELVGRTAELGARAADDEGPRVSRPFRGGRVVDPESAAVLLDHLLKDAPRRRTLRAATAHADAPFAALGVAEHTPLGSAALRGAGAAGATALAVVIGRSTTVVAAVVRGRIASSITVDVGGETFDGAVVRHLRASSALAIGPATAERAKLRVGAAHPSALADVPAAVEVAGRCLRAGVPRRATVSSVELAAAFQQPTSAVSAAVRRALEVVPEEAAAEILQQGVVLAGGGAALPGLDAALRQETGLLYLLADDPAMVVLHGAAATPTEELS